MADGDAYNDGKVYLVTGATLNALKSADAKNVLNVVGGSGLEITERSEYAGTVLNGPGDTESDGLTTEDVQELIDNAIAALPTMDLEVCIDGSAQTVTVLLPPG